MVKERMRRHEPVILAAVLLLALLVRLPFIMVDFPTSGDLNIFVRWARLLQTRSLATAYDGTGIDYPPLSVYLFAAASGIESHLPDLLRLGDGALIALIKLPPAVADVLTAWAIAWALQRQAPRVRILACGFYAFNPAIWYVSAYWAQTDSVYSLFLIISMLMLARGNVVPAWLTYTLALGAKVQSIALAPWLVVATWLGHGVRGLISGLTAGVVAGMVLVLPWLVTGQLENLVRACTTIVPRIDESAYNLWYLVRLGRVHNVSSALHPLALPVSYKEIGIGLFAAFVLFVLVLVWYHQGKSLAVAAALLNMGLFMFLTEIHERYLLPTLAFVLLAAVGWDSHPQTSMAGRAEAAHRSLWVIYALLSLTFLFNLITVVSFAPALWTNLIASPPPDSTLVLILKGFALMAAALNVLSLVVLVVDLVRAHSKMTSRLSEP